MRKRLPLVVAGWLITGLLAIGAGVAVIDRLSEPLTDTGLRPLSAAEVDEALALASSLPSAPPTAPSPSESAPSESAPSESAPSETDGVEESGEATPEPATTATPAAEPGESRLIITKGGRVIARCEGGLVTLRSWSPAQGFQADDVERGPADRARVEFESEEDEVKVEVRCAADGSPVHRLHS
ncbi:hypothetical protein [Streptosporangium sp. NPDC049046]|uniref:hypothetical protein n=1 Tax=Streptosporangium sp. NPDC049046 TaxID=3155031 RepID=UPI003430C0A8